MKNNFANTFIISFVFLIFIISGCTSGVKSEPTSMTPKTELLVTTTLAKADLKIKSLDVIPSEITTGQSSTATVVITNTGDIEGTYAVTLRVDSIALETKEVVVTPGSSKSATFSIKKNSPGTYDIQVEDFVTKLIVKQSPITTTVIKTTPPAIKDAIDVSFDPNPVTLIEGQIHWKSVLIEKKGVGVNIKKVTRQFYSESGPMGTLQVFSNVSQWFQNLSGTYLPPNQTGIIGAGSNFQGPNWPKYAIETFYGTDDNGNEVVAEGRIDFIH
jgi:hypothetical protein